MCIVRIKVKKHITILLLIINSQASFGNLTHNFRFFEYGFSVGGEQLSCSFSRIIPPYRPLYNLLVKSTRKELLPTFSHIKVAYYNLVSKVNIDYQPVPSILTFHIKFPFVGTPVAVFGYSFPAKNKRYLADSKNEG